MAIQSFIDKKLATVWTNRRGVKGFPGDQVARTLRRLDQLDAAVELSDLILPPSNHLEALKGDREGQHSIRVNQQYRICFVWTDDGPDALEFVDYH